MVDDASRSAAAAAGAAVVEAMGSEAWYSVRSFAARLLSRGDPRAEEAHAVRLDRDLALLMEARDERTRIRLEAAWQTRFEMLLETAPESETSELVEQLDHVVLRHPYAVTAVSGPVQRSAPSPVRAPLPPSRVEWTPLRAGADSAPTLVGSIPAEVGPFCHRAEADLLDAGFDEPSAARALVGPAGVGKTRLAARVARHMLLDGAVDLVVWVTATSEDAVVWGYAEAAAVVTEHSTEQPERAAQAFRSWLSWTDRRWLVVLDGLPDFAGLQDLWPPKRPNGRVLVTTRHPAPPPNGTGRVEIGRFGSEAADGLLRLELGAQGRLGDPAEATALASDLGRHPLALSTAAACLVYSGQSLADYRGRLADLTRRLPGAAGPDPVTACWWLSLETADRHSAGLARPLLELAAVLDPHRVPVAVLTSEPALHYLARRRGAADGETPGALGRSRPVESAEALHTLDVLHRVRLVESRGDAEHPTVGLSSLVQDAVRAAVPSGVRHRLVLSAADALREVWGPASAEPRSALCRALRSGTDILATHARGALWKQQCHPVLFQAGRNLITAGLIRAARMRWEWLHAALHQHFGPDHPDTLAARGHRAWVRGAAQDAPGAVAAYRELLDDLVRVLGPDHSDVFTVRDNLARWQGVAGDPARAAVAYTDLLADRLRALGPDHRDTLLTRHNLALWRGEAGDAAEAAAAYAELLDDMVRVFGPDDDAVLRIRDQLTEWRNRAADAATATRVPVGPAGEAPYSRHPHAGAGPPRSECWAPPVPGGQGGTPHGARTAPSDDEAKLSAGHLLLKPSWTSQWRRRLARRGGSTAGEPRSGRDVLRSPLSGSHRIAVISLKGGTGKTTTAAMLGATLAGLREDPVVAVDASPEGGTLGHRVSREAGSKLLDLLAALPQLHGPEDVRGFAGPGPDGLEVFANDVSPALSVPFGAKQYQQVVDALSRTYPIVVTDSGASLMQEAMRGVLTLADQLVIVATASVDGAEVASVTMDWLSAHGHAELARSSLVVLSSVHARSRLVKAHLIAEHFARRCRGVVTVPFDEHLATGAELDPARLRADTRRAYVDLAVLVAEGFPSAHPGAPIAPEAPTETASTSAAALDARFSEFPGVPDDAPGDAVEPGSSVLGTASRPPPPSGPRSARLSSPAPLPPPAPRPRLRARVTVAEDVVCVGEACTLEFRLTAADPPDMAEPHPPQQNLLVVATTRSRATVEPPAVDCTANDEPARFAVTAGEAGTHRVRFSVYDAENGRVLQVLETTLPVATAPDRESLGSP
ncbi:MinD/ParA family protein [Streptomyces sp. WMMB303]|uniref:MinD/ParA family ATP-binding protein n=1 Tax=Streptomyces sp. WMMB303 TaxID=3034154 RepID=UPI0023ED4456|nr:MinD/ParA family protein [Streptomyces sp. WMMB303]MDF4253668.1 MinD/ParA family protein [Streptomyces sp. WMMB303]